MFIVPKGIQNIGTTNHVNPTQTTKHAISREIRHHGPTR
jgi:hypothetical protein